MFQGFVIQPIITEFYKSDKENLRKKMNRKESWSLPYPEENKKENIRHTRIKQKSSEIFEFLSGEISIEN
jgi:hypothetical protein